MSAMITLLEHATCHFARRHARERRPYRSVAARQRSWRGRHALASAALTNWTPGRPRSMEGAMSVQMANAKGRASVVLGGRIADVERASGGRFSADPMAAVQRWDALVEWERGLAEGDAEVVLNEVDLRPPVPRPAKVFAIGLNYREHTQEA